MLRDRYPQYDIGRGTYGKPTIIDHGEGAALKIGAFCSISVAATIFLGAEHRMDWVTTYPFNILNEDAVTIKGRPKTKGDVTIGNDVWIGYGATILSGVTIGNGAVIGSQAVVAKDVEPYAIVVGNPARVTRKRFSEEIIRKLEQIAWWSWSDEEIERALPLLLSNDLDAFIRYGVTRPDRER